MTEQTPRDPALPATVDDGVEPDDTSIGFDMNGFDPADYEWRPVPRRPRADGWSPEVQRRFIAALAETGLVQEAARAVDMSVASAYRLRVAAGSEGFAAAWSAAVHAAADRLADIAFTRAIEGEEVPVFDRDGSKIGARIRHNDRLLMFLLRAYRPDRFRHAHRDGRPVDEVPARPEPTLARAAATLGPVVPDAPHRLMPPDDLEAVLLAAHIRADNPKFDGDWQREPYAPVLGHDDADIVVHRRQQRFARDRARALAAASPQSPRKRPPR